MRVQVTLPDPHHFRRHFHQFVVLDVGDGRLAGTTITPLAMPQLTALVLQATFDWVGDQMRNKFVGATAALSIAVPALAQTTQTAPLSGYARFVEFFKPLIGIWPVRILDRDAEGKTEYETTQLRDFRFSVGGAFVRETAIIRDSAGRQIEAGVHLYGYDRPRDRVLLHGFWGNSADRFVFVLSRIEGAGRDAKLVGTMTVTHPDGRVVESASEMGWSDPETFVWRTFSKRPDGSTYTDEQLTYTIAPVDVMRAR